MSTDEELWRRAIEGDSLAFGEIFDRHNLRVLRHSFRVLGVKEDAEDVTAIVFLEAWRRRRHVRIVNGSVIAWLLTAPPRKRRIFAVGLITAGSLALGT